MFRVERVYRGLTEQGVQIAPSGYHAFGNRPGSAGEWRDEELLAQIEPVFWDRSLDRAISGARKVRHLVGRQGITVESVMRAHGRASRQIIRHDSPRRVRVARARPRWSRVQGRAFGPVVGAPTSRLKHRRSDPPPMVDAERASLASHVVSADAQSVRSGGQEGHHERERDK